MSSPPLTPLSLASLSRYEEINWVKLTQADIAEKDKDGKTLLHRAAFDGYWEMLPNKFQDRKYWSDDLEGNSIYMSAYLGKFNRIWLNAENLSEDDIIKTNKEGFCIAQETADNGEFRFFPKKLMSLRVLTYNPYETEETNEGTNIFNKDKIIHLLARSGQFDAIPKSMLTENLLRLKGKYGESLYHILTGKDGIKQTNLIPRDLLTRQALIEQSESGITALHRIAAHQSNLVPKEVTLEDLLLRNKDGVTILHSWSGGPGWIDIPDKFLTSESLSVKDNFDESPLDYIINEYKDNWADKTDPLKSQMKDKLKSILKKIGEEDLKKLNRKQSAPLISPVKKEMIRRTLLKHVQTEKTIEL